MPQSGTTHPPLVEPDVRISRIRLSRRLSSASSDRTQSGVFARSSSPLSQSRAFAPVARRS